MSLLTVLIVDDSLTVRMDLAEAFDAAGYRVTLCATAAEARREFQSLPVDVVILDVLLPDGDGVELLRELRGSGPSSDAVVLMLSSEAEVKDRIRGLQTGADDYVGKPYDRGYVVAKARELLRARSAPDVAAQSVLVIDADEEVRTRLCTAIEASDHPTLSAETGAEGLRIAADQRPAAIVVAGALPDMDGPTLIRRIRFDAALRGIPCVLLIADPAEGAELRALDAGADAAVPRSAETSLVLAKLGAALRAAAREWHGERGTSLLAPRKILTVDPSPELLHELVATLRGEGYDVVQARSGEEALELLAVESVDCILMEVDLPGMSGHAACQRIKETPLVRDIPLILLTSRGDHDAVIAGLTTGADDFISRSQDLQVLRARVQAQLRRKQFQDETRHIHQELLRREMEASEERSARILAETRAALAEELERKNRELEAFSYSVSHDLRAPLRGIDGFSQALIEDYADLLDERGLGYLDRVRAAAQRMGELIDDLLQLSRVGRFEISHSRVDLSELARDVAREIARRESGRKLTWVIQDRLSVEGDERLLRILLENLFSNAWKFTSKREDPRIELGVNAVERRRVYYVRDNGAGFSMEYASKLFRPFARLHSDAEFPGTGIGLATVRRIVERHGGRVWAEGIEGTGTTVFFELEGGHGGGGSW